MKKAILAAVALAALVAGCDEKKSADQAAPTASAAASAATPAASTAAAPSATATATATAAAAPTATTPAPVPEQYEAKAQTGITNTSVSSELDKLDKEIGQ
jgi:hypothetical protein